MTKVRKTHYRRVLQATAGLLAGAAGIQTPISVQAGFQSQIGIESSFFPTAVNGYGESFFPSLGFRSVATKEFRLARIEADVYGRIFFSRSTPFYINAAQIYAISQPGVLGPITLSVGRKHVDWNSLDETFRLGIWEPRFRWDPIAPESVGLIGLFGETQFGILKLSAFVSPLSIPEMGAPMNFENGSITSPSPYGMAAMSSADVLGTSTPVVYDLQMPTVANLILNPALAIQARLGAAFPPSFKPQPEYDPKQSPIRPGGTWAAAGYAFKPINQPLMMYAFGLNAAGSYVALNLQPRIGYHHLASLESGYESENFGVWVSSLGEVPMGLPEPGAWSYQRTVASIAGALNLEFRLGRGYTDSPRFRLSGLLQSGGNTTDGNPPPPGSMSGPSTGSNFEFRYPFQQAIQGQIWTATPYLSHTFIHSRILYDVGHDSILTSAALLVRPAESWLFGVSADLFLTGITRYTGDRPLDFVGAFHNNSRIQAQANYVF